MISIIIPVYNGQNMIMRCYESLINQTNKNYEIIFINDGSTDDSLKILEEISEKDSDIRIIDQINQGVVIARENGIKLAKGDYLTFVDVDDTLPKNSLEIFISTFGRTNADIVVGKYQIIDEKGKYIRNKDQSSGLFTNEKFISHVFSNLGWELWAKAYKRNLFDQERKFIPEGLIIGEDAVVLTELSILSNQIAIINDFVYNYYSYSSSTSKIKSDYYANEGIKAARIIEKIIKKHQLENKLQKEIDAIYLLLYSNSLRRGYISDSKIKIAIKDRININSLYLIGLKKSCFILLNLYGGKFVYSLLKQII